MRRTEAFFTPSIEISAYGLGGAVDKDDSMAVQRRLKF